MSHKIFSYFLVFVYKLTTNMAFPFSLETVQKICENNHNVIY